MGSEIEAFCIDVAEYLQHAQPAESLFVHCILWQRKGPTW